MKRHLSIVYWLFYCLSVFSQNKTEGQKLAEWVVTINNFNHLYPQEKVYLHFDNTAYFKGETVWFKAYVLTAENNALSPLSKVLYVELLTPEGEIVETQKLKIDNGEARGSFNLEDRLYAGYYEIRAYTRCMLNFGEEVIFSRVFPVYDMPKQAGDYNRKKMSVRGSRISRNLRKEEKTKDLNLDFFPEGGNLITGIANRVAFKATDKEGKALDVTGGISNPSGEEITSFASLHLGMGSFILYPDGNKLIAKIRYNNKEYTFDLPESKPEGYTLCIENLHPETLSVQVEKTANLPARTLGMTFACRGKVYAFKAFEPDSSGQYILRLPKEDLPSGVVQITLFTPQGEVLAQRQAFVNNNIRALPVKVKQMQASFEPFSPVSIAFEVKDDSNQPVETTFSLSVRDEATEVSTNYTDNILYNLLLSSDLKGYIENPAWYFEADDNRHRLALDLLMLVQGWTRYAWKPAAGVEEFKIKHFIEKKLMFEGSVLSPGRAKPVEGIEVSMWMTSLYGESQQGKCITDKEGKFNFALADLTGTFDLNLQTKQRGKLYASYITLDRNFLPVPFALNYYETHPAETAKNEKDEISAPDQPVEADVQMEEINIPGMQLNKNPEEVMRSYVLPEVEVKGKIPPRRAMLQRLLPYAEEYHNVFREIEKDRDEGRSETGSIADLLMSVSPYIVCVETMDDYGNLKVDIRYKGSTAFVAADDMLVENLADLSTGEIEHVVIRENPDHTPDSNGKIIYRIDLILNENGAIRKDRKGFRTTYYEGFARSVEFYSPDYSMATLPDPDFRRTLYWNPDVKTDRLGHASVLFYNNGTCKKLSISAEGLTDGNVPVMYNENED